MLCIKKAASAPVPEAAPVSDTAPADATEDEIEKAARKAWNFTWIGAGLTGLIGVFGLPFLITGIIKSDRVARKLRKQKGHPKEKELMKKHKMSVYGGKGLFFGVVAFYLFILFLVF